MRLLIQRVTSASVTIDNNDRHAIKNGLCVFIGITHSDNTSIMDKAAQKLISLRIFEDGNGKINHSVTDINGEILLVSQFSLYASCSKGNRPGFTDAAKPEFAEKLYNYFVDAVKSKGLKNVQTGKFGADMSVEIINDGPLTFIVDID